MHPHICSFSLPQSFSVSGSSHSSKEKCFIFSISTSMPQTGPSGTIYLPFSILIYSAEYHRHGSYGASIAREKAACRANLQIAASLSPISNRNDNEDNPASSRSQLPDIL
jgi:hypothetical protein